MTRRPGLVWFTVLLVLTAIPSSMALGAPSRIRPAGDAETVRIRVAGKRSTYHVATREQPVEYEVTGPAAIRVLSRYLLAGEDPEVPLTYGLRLEIDGVELRTIGEAAELSNDATIPGGGVVGSLERSVVQIPSGSHRLRIQPDTEGARVALRLFHGSGRPTTAKWVSYAPQGYAGVVRLHGRDTEVIYYRVSAEEPVIFNINGPTRVRVMTRIDFEEARGYSQAYVIKTSLDGELTQSCALKSRASHTSTYPELPEVTPGVARDVFFDVPDGRHEVSIALDCTTSKSASLRILIPEKAVTNGA